MRKEKRDKKGKTVEKETNGDVEQVLHVDDDRVSSVSFDERRRELAVDDKPVKCERRENGKGRGNCEGREGATEKS
jgi:hypothetical protein